MLMDAHFSEDRRFRYSLVRQWEPAAARACFVLFNPSKASATERDATDRKCEGFARRLGCGGFTVVNAYAFIATDPADLRDAGYPTGGAANDRAIFEAARMATSTWGPIVVAWGSLCKGLSRPAEVVDRLRRAGFVLKVLALNADGAPAHPGRLAYQDGIPLKLYPRQG